MKNYDYDIRLNRLIGQIEGVRKMIHDNRSEESIVQQIIASREALTKIAMMITKTGLTKSKNVATKNNLLKQIFRI